MLRTVTTLVVLLSLCFCVQAVASSYYVSPEGDNAYNGLSPDSAWRNVSYATMQVGNNPFDPDTVLVSPGLYDVSVREIFPVRVRSYTTLVGLDIGCILSARDTSRVEVIRINQNQLVQVENLELREGDGGINVNECTEVVIKDNFIHHNQRHRTFTSTLGGGIAVLASREITIKGNVVRENEVSESQSLSGGGGIGIAQSTGVTVDSNIVSVNTVDYRAIATGGGLALSGCDSVNIRYNSIDSNLVTSSAVRPRSLGGGIYLDDCGEVSILENRIHQNAVHGQAPDDSCFCHGGGIYVSDGSAPITISGNLISDNSPTGNCEFARGDGGGVKVDNAYVIFRDNTIEANEARYGGGADGWGGGVAVGSQSVCYFFRNRIYGNRAGNGGAIGAYFPDSLTVGGAPGQGNDLYDNDAERGDDLWKYYYGPPDTFSATFNYFGGQPGGARVYPLEYWDVSFWRDSLIDVNEPPHFIDYFPAVAETTLDIGDSLLFWVEVLDYDGDTTSNWWLLNGETVAFGDSFLFIADSQYGGYDTVQAVATDYVDTTTQDWLLFVGQAGVASGDRERDLPSEFALRDNYPNPFNSSTIIRYELPRDCHVRLEVFDILGRKAATLVTGREKAGYHAVIWNAREAATGFYFYRLFAGDFSDTKRMVLLK
jgi:hypothetical protein